MPIHVSGSLHVLAVRVVRKDVTEAGSMLRGGVMWRLPVDGRRQCNKEGVEAAGEW